ncbi:MAG: UDP-N-acetylmuramoyl-L-alanyl-D-glutamate--2,6-diaminopimelate ligase [Acidimicrobiia bacterium]|nr:UDP-N-acetylmuramoyl-L-alanyl-D-glutamate--2,6-diaminopimelate ligase [Acidimicrobiia bacterium]
MTLGDLLRVLDPPEGWLGAAEVRLDAPATAITLDSRTVTPGSVFVAVPGRNADGADFATDALAAGAAVVVAERPAPAGVGQPWLVVPDARAALSALAAELHGHPSLEMTVVGVTGTNGKTTTAYLLAAIFEAAGLRCGLLGTVAYRLGAEQQPATRTTPEAPDVHALMRRMADAGCGTAVLEVSSHALAMRRVDHTRFGAAVFTNLTRDHLDYHVSMEAYFAAKRRLFELLPSGAPGLVNLDDPRGQELAAMPGRRITYALTRPADITPGPLSTSLDGLAFDARTPAGTVRIRSRLVGRPNASNVLAAVGTAVALGIPRDAIERGVAGLQAVPGRFQLVSGPGDDVAVLVDYAHTDDALRGLLETARGLTHGRLITLFGCGGDRDRSKRPLMGMVAARLSDLVIVTSDNPRTEDPARVIEEVLRGARAEERQGGAELLSLVDRREAIHEAIRRARPGDMVLVAGKGHETTQEIAGRSVPFDDVAVAGEALAARRVESRVG